MAFIRKQLLTGGTLHGFGKIVTLTLVTAHAAQKSGFFLGLDTFCQQRDAHPFDQAHHETEHAAFLAFLAGLQKMHVQLNHVKRHIPQQVQGRIATAEIIHIQRKTGSFQGVGHLHHLVGILGIRSFRKLQFQQMQRQVIFMHQVL